MCYLRYLLFCYLSGCIFIVTGCAGSDKTSQTPPPDNTSQNPPSQTSPQPKITVLAGSATSAGATVDGTGADAVFWGGGHIALDHSGNVLVSDRGMLRKVSPAGVVTTNNAFHGIDGITLDSADNIFVSGNYFTSAPSLQWNGYIQALSASGTVTNIAVPWCSSPSDPSIGFGGLTMDSQGNLYLPDRNNSRIIRVTQSGAVSVIAGSGVSGATDGVGTAATFDHPTDVAIDSKDNLYVADTRNLRVRRVAPDGTVSTVVKLQWTGSAIAVDPSGYIYISGWPWPGWIQRISPSGDVTSIALPGISDPVAALVSDANGNLYATTHGIGAQILKISFN